MTRIVVVLGAAVGRWRTAMEILLASFPVARIDCLVDAANVWETRAWSHPRVQVELIEDWDRALISEGQSRDPVIGVRVPPWPVGERWRGMILQSEDRAERERSDARRRAQLGQRPQLWCRSLGEICNLLSEFGPPPPQGSR